MTAKTTSQRTRAVSRSGGRGGGAANPVLRLQQQAGNGALAGFFVQRAPGGGGGATAPSGMNISDEGLQFIAKAEGFESNLYKDVAGLWTIGYGHLIKPGEKDKYVDGISKDDALALLRSDAATAVAGVRKLITVSLSQAQFDALVSFTFNLGVGALEGSTLRKKLNAGDYAAVPGQMMLWVNAGGKKVEGLVNRRKGEAEMFGGTPVATGGGVATAAAPAKKQALPSGAAPLLKQGSDGDAVKKLQGLLIGLGLLPVGSDDGDFGPKTDAAVRAFQSSHKLNDDGVVGEKTWAVLAAAAPKKPAAGAKSATAPSMTDLLWTGLEVAGQEVSAAATAFSNWLFGSSDTKTASTAGGKGPPKPAPTSGAGATALSWARTKTGFPYCWGGTGGTMCGFEVGGSSPVVADPPFAAPKGQQFYDCSGFSQGAWAAAGVGIPRSSKAQYAGLAESAVPDASRQPGDLVFFGKPTIHHVGIYTANGNMIHAPKSKDVIKESSADARSDYVGARRPEGGGGGGGNTPAPPPTTTAKTTPTTTAVTGGTAATTAAPTSGSDPAIEKLDLSATTKKAAYTLKGKHPSVSFTSGRRGFTDQARAMASNVVLNRQWIVQTYAKSTAITALQKWVDDHPDVKDKQGIQDGLTSVINGLTEGQKMSISKHLTGNAFDVQPVEKDADKIKATIKGLPGLGKFLEKEGGLVRWHAQF